MIRYLENGEKCKSRQLWRESFEEDSERFLDYYFEEKTRENRILVKEVGGRIVSMIHQNPYWIAAGKMRWKCSYFVGVATAREYRRRGYMKQLMERSLTDMYREGMPFGFLMPAFEELYLPFGFTCIVLRPEWRLTDSAKAVLHRKPFTEELAEETARWMEEWLERNYEVHAVRTGEYVMSLQRELESEDGFMELLYERSRLVGVKADWGIERREQRMLLCEQEFCHQKGTGKSCIMARIINLPIFIQSICLHETAKIPEKTVMIQVMDTMIPENTGIWKWKLRKDGSSLMRIPYGEKLVKAEVTMKIQEMTAWLFGYEVPKSAGELNDWVRPLKSVFLDEIV